MIIDLYSSVRGDSLSYFQFRRTGALHCQIKKSGGRRISAYLSFHSFYSNFMACFGIWFDLHLVTLLTLCFFWCGYHLIVMPDGKIVLRFLPTNTLVNGLYTGAGLCDMICFLSFICTCMTFKIICQMYMTYSH